MAIAVLDITERACLTPKMIKGKKKSERCAQNTRI